MYQKILENTLHYIDTHIEKSITLAELAEFSGYSPFYFSTLFSKIMGISVTRYIRIRKLQHSIVPLLQGDKIIDIAFRFGFESHEAYTRSFTQIFGSTPSTVRKQLNSYQVPEYRLDHMDFKEVPFMKTKETPSALLHQIVMTFVQESITEALEGHGNKISIEFLSAAQVKITDNGRGIPLTENHTQNQLLLDKLFSGQPLSPLDYASTEDYQSLSLNIANSLCESLTLKIYRNGKLYQQDYVRGIAQHDIFCSDTSHESGMEILLSCETL